MTLSPRSTWSGMRLAAALLALCVAPLALGASGCKSKEKKEVAPAAAPGAAAPVAGAGGLATTSGGLLEFETAIKWDAVTGDWPTRRMAWQSAVKAAPTAQALGAQLIALETAMGWGAVQPTWAARRPGWVAEIAAAQTAGQVAKLIMELETSTKWEVVQPTWAQARPGWGQKLLAVR